MKNKILLLLIFTIVFCGFTNKKYDVLIIGDSISMGYTPILKKVMADKANVVHNYGNAQYTEWGINNLDQWLGDKKWDVIHFNFGLHDLCYRDRQKRGMASRDKVNGELETTLEEYGQNLEIIVKRLKKTGARLIFANTTYVPDNEPGRFQEDVKKYNKVALKVMKKYDIPVNDLYKTSAKIFPEFGNGNDDVHYKAGGYSIMAKQVMEAILKSLE